LQLFEQGLIAENAEDAEIASLRKLRVNSRVNGGLLPEVGGEGRRVLRSGMAAE